MAVHQLDMKLHPSFKQNKQCITLKSRMWAKSSSSKVTVKQIRDLFNEKYAAVAGKGKKMPYSMQNSFTVSGLPDGLQLRQPSRYGTKQLREIWDARDSIVILLLSS
ncbi:hypothetical protein BSL78_08812 [Apostichopus japonicus]|uniref:Uncharacterized protein n=1 Tax=Stichopus japonicus TaxID=307972 RepID=A0A2G8L1Z3_STIJA|nr:hypothetical protein BSL78_08812 [Apostichopus japonicus]